METILETLRVAFPWAPERLLRWAAKRITMATWKQNVHIATDAEWDERYSDGYGAGGNNSAW